MSGIIYKKISRPPKELIVAFKDIPTSIASDSMNRMNCMHASIKPVIENVSIVGPAVTVKSMVGDNIMSHYAICEAEPGDLLVIDARGHMDTSVWGFIQTTACKLKGIEAVIIDGTIRDIREIRDSHFPIFCKGATPAGPHKGWGGSINEPIQCGGVPVDPGDIIIGDDDGVVVIPQRIAQEVLERSKKRLEMEKEWMQKLNRGLSTVEIFGFDRKIKQLGIEVK